MAEAAKSSSARATSTTLEKRGVARRTVAGRVIEMELGLEETLS